MSLLNSIQLHRAMADISTHCMHLIFMSLWSTKEVLFSNASLGILAHVLCSLGNSLLWFHLMLDNWTPFMGFLYSSNAEPRYSLFPVRSRPPAESGFDGAAAAGGML